MDAVELLKRDDRALAGLLRRWERTGRRAPRRRQELIDQIIRATASHISVQERVLYPVLRDTGEGDLLVERALQDHRLAERGLATIQRTDPWDGEMDSATHAMVRLLRRHLLEEEMAVTDVLGRNMTLDRLRQIGGKLERAKRTAPTRPHPRVPRRTAMRAVADPVVGVVDRGLDSLRGIRRSLLRGRRWLLGGLDL